MKQLRDIVYWASKLDRTLPGVAVDLLKQGLTNNPLGGQIMLTPKWILNHIRTLPYEEKITDKNLSIDEKGRWGRVFGKHMMNWNIRARVSQTEGIEITRANFKNNLITKNHQLFPLEYLLRRAKCKFGPFFCEYKTGLVVGGLYNPENNFFVLQLFWFSQNGRTTSQLISSGCVDSDHRFNYQVKALNIRTRNGDGIWKKLKTFPYRVDSEDLSNPERVLCIDSNGHGNCWISFIQNCNWNCGVSEYDGRSKLFRNFCISFEVQSVEKRRIINGPILEVSNSRKKSNL